MDRVQLREEEGVNEPPPLALGTELPDGLVLDRVIDGDGRVVVYEAVRSATGERVALKVPRFDLEPSDRDALLVAIRASASISGTHILRVIESGVTADGHLYWTTELATRGSLRKYLARGAFGERDAAKIMAQTCAALEEAHFLGHPHGDLRLEKILLAKKDDGRPTIKVSDVGFARELAAVLGARVRPTTAPEQLEGELDARSDVYAIGALAYELVAARELYFAANDEDLAKKIEGQEPNPLSLLAPATSPRFVQVLHKALVKVPIERWQTCREFEAEVRGAIGVAAGPSVIWDAPKPRLSRFSIPPKKRAPLGMLAVGILLGIIAMTFLARDVGQKEGTPRANESAVATQTAPTAQPSVATPVINSASGVVRSIIHPETQKKPPSRLGN